MNKELIAVDVDDVLADTTEALREFVNKATGLNLTSEDYDVPAAYWGYYKHVWMAAGITDHSHIHAFHEKLGTDQRDIQPVADSQDVIERLSSRFDFIAVTSRELFMEVETKRWIHKHFNGVFKDVVLLGHVKTAKHTKGDACLELGAQDLIDDNYDHCKSALDVSVRALLFGNYGWNREVASNGIERAHDWQEVLAYFENEG